jgi:DNA polymerase/3'-5' exonuclease PolX
MDVVRQLKSTCERVCIAGSIRRQKPRVKDIEIVYIPKMIRQKVDLFDYEERPMTDYAIDGLIDFGFWEFDTETSRNGPKYKRLVHMASSMTVELFRARPQNWGLVMALRTGPAEFNHLLVTPAAYYGAMPGDMEMSDGYLWRQGRMLETPTETSFFGELGLPYWPPQTRTEQRLNEYLRNGRGGR